MEESISSKRVKSFCSSLAPFAFTMLIVTQGLGFDHFFQMFFFTGCCNCIQNFLGGGILSDMYGGKFSFKAIP